MAATVPAVEPATLLAAHREERKYSISRPSRSARCSAASVRRFRASQRWRLCFGMRLGRSLNF
jgi:hypothetical protein